MKRGWVILKHALGSFDEEDGYNKRNENAIGLIRFLIVFTMMVSLIINNSFASAVADQVKAECW